MVVKKRNELAIQRNLAELQRAILNRTTLLGFEDVGGISHIFLKLSYHAFFNDYVAHCIKIFDRNSKSASFGIFIVLMRNLSLNLCDAKRLILPN